MNPKININKYSEGINFLSKDDVLGPHINRISPPKYSLDKDFFESLCKYIIFQQLSIKSASKTYIRFKSLIKNIKPEIILKSNDESIRNTGVSNRKIEYLKELSKSFIENKNYEFLKNKNDNEIIEILSKIKGIGSWTAEMFLIFTMGRLDVFSVKDIGLLNALKIVYKLDYRPSFEEANLLCNRWSPYKTIASLYLWKIIDGGDLYW